MYKVSSIIRACAWAFIAILLLAVLFSNLGGTSLFASQSDTRNTSVRAEGASSAGALDAKPIRTLKIEWVAGSVDVSFYDGDTIQFSETASTAISERDSLYYEVKGDTLTINFYRSASILSFLRTSNKALRVEIPRSHSLEALTINGVSSNVTVDGGETQIKKVSLETVSGAINLLRLASERLDLHTVSGEMSASGSFDRVRTESVSGITMLKLDFMPESFKGDSVSGDFEVALPENSGFTAKLDSVSGSMRADFGQMDSKQRVVYKDGEIDLSFSTVSGSVMLSKHVMPAAPALEAAPVAPPMPSAPALGDEDDGSRLSVPSGSRGF